MFASLQNLQEIIEDMWIYGFTEGQQAVVMLTGMAIGLLCGALVLGPTFTEWAFR